MPLFALAYGSFGDIVATVQLAIKIAIILRQRGTPSMECKKTEAELKSLSGDLDLAHLTLQRMSASPSLPFVTKRLQDEVSRCHKLMAQFFTKITVPEGLWDRVWWAASQEKKLAAFRAQVIERRTVLSLIVDFMNSCVTFGTLLALQDRIESTDGSVSVLSQQLTTYHAEIVASIGQVPQRISEAMFVVVSPTGVSIPISVTLCDSYRVLDRILKAYMQDRKAAGGHYVERGDYNVVSPEGEIIRPPQFLDNLRVGTTLEISILKRHDTAGAKGCPQCGGTTVETPGYSVGQWITCSNLNCGSRYRMLASNPVQFDSEEEFLFSQAQSSRRKGLHGTIYEGAAACFRRIQLVPFDVYNGKHSRTELNNIVARRGQRVEYTDTSEGSLANLQWTSIVYLDGHSYGRGYSTTKGRARECAAEKAVGLITQGY
ncbi:hypothetical protein C8R44DRAFT_973817 [Mycena epipterygia]|nr:hypothetical protein C8R44DRAFT_973817 [Mycena epipterygia]